MENRKIIQVEEKVPPKLLIPLSIQHMFAMFGASVLVPSLFGMNPAIVLFMNGIGTLLFILITKGKAPAYLGSSFAFIAPSLVVMGKFGYEYALGGFVVVGLCGCILSLIIYKFGSDWIDVVLPPAAMGPVVALIGLELSGTAAKNAGLLDEKCEQLLKMAERLLELSRTGQVESHMQPVDLAELFRNTCEELTGLEPGRKFLISVKEIPVLNADPALMKLLAQNIFSNAIKFTPRRETAEITVSCTEDASGLTVTVKDNGAGFDQANAGKLFQVFSRLHDTSQFEGTGVGLTIVERIMRTHEGSVSISGEPDRGAAVTLHFPRKLLCCRTHREP